MSEDQENTNQSGSPASGDIGSDSVSGADVSDVGIHVPPAVPESAESDLPGENVEASPAAINSETLGQFLDFDDTYWVRIEVDMPAGSNATTYVELDLRYIERVAVEFEDDKLMRVFARYKNEQVSFITPLAAQSFLDKWEKARPDLKEIDERRKAGIIKTVNKNNPLRPIIG